jgi:outer membrane protein OmpA-like peptidoglycan-associated protein
MSDRLFAGVISAILLLMPINALAQADAKGSKDHPIFTRMPGYRIASFEASEFDQFRFAQDADGTKAPVEGKLTRIAYSVTRETKSAGKTASGLQIVRNYSNAIKKIGGMVVRETPYDVTMKLVKDDGGEVWAYVWNENTDEYGVVVVEKSEMKQEVTASDMLTALQKEGRLALYINFDTGKAEIKAESMPVIDEIVSLLRNNRQLNINIEGHTDNVGGAGANLALSEARAKAVMDAIVSKGVGAARVSAAGFGQTKPIADNATDAGRAKNRRVELVKK